MPYTSEVLELGSGRSLHLTRAGSGAPIVLLHGAMTTHVDWLEAPLAAFAKRGLALAVDRPGHGASERPRFAAAPGRQAAQVRDGLAAIGVERPILVAHSFGAMVALAYASAWPEEVAGLLLLGPIGRSEFRPMEHLLFAPRAAPLIGPLLAEFGRHGPDPAMLPLMQKAMFHPGTPPGDWLERFPAECLLTARQLVAEAEDASTMLPGSPFAAIDFTRVTAPVHIVAGTGDLVVDHNRHARVLARQLPDAELTLVEGVGHMVHHMALDAVLAGFEALRPRVDARPLRAAA